MNVCRSGVYAFSPRYIFTKVELMIIDSNSATLLWFGCQLYRNGRPVLPLLLSRVLGGFFLFNS